MNLLSFKPIGFVSSPYLTKFAVPRQPGLAANVRGQIVINPDPDLKTALQGLEAFTHLWVIFVFHAHGANKWKPSIRPPRLGGNQKMGVLASRSPHRPNPIGLSAVKLISIDWDSPKGVILNIQGHDLLDQTPVLDIKPYVTYADSIPEAQSAWAQPTIPRYPVTLSPEAVKALSKLPQDKACELESMIVEILSLDPRPAFQQRKYPITTDESQGRRYGVDLLGYDVKYEIKDQGLFVSNILRATAGSV